MQSSRACRSISSNVLSIVEALNQFLTPALAYFSGTTSLLQFLPNPFTVPSVKSFRPCRRINLGKALLQTAETILKASVTKSLSLRESGRKPRNCPGLLPVLLFLLLGSTALGKIRGETPMGVDANYAIEMESKGATWHDGTATSAPYPLLAQNGCETFRVRLWVGDGGPSQLTYATETAQRAQRAGLKPYLVIFLSNSWADINTQPAAKEWTGLSPDAKIAAIRNYAERVTRHFAEAGIAMDTYEIGNEIDFGICGEFEKEWPRRVSIDYMRQRIWLPMAPLILAAENGVRAAQPHAKFILHLARWDATDYNIAFLQFMRSAGVQVDFTGLSYYPTSGDNDAARPFPFLQAQAKQLNATLHTPVVLCETAYPAQPKFGGMFSTWNHAVDGYPLSPEGQAAWIRDLARIVRTAPDFAGAYYWSPEWYGHEPWEAMAVFDAKGQARPGLRSFQK